MKRFIILIVFVFIFVVFISCKKDDQSKEFTDVVNENTSYSLSGIMESFYPNGRKQNDFNVMYKSKNYIKVCLSNNDETKDVSQKQIILKNNDGVYILIPSINKNFKIQSSWPDGANYPYLLYSLVKDIKENDNVVVTDNDSYVTYETSTCVFKNDNKYKEKIIVDKSTNLPVEVLIYDDNNELFIRVVFNEIKINVSIDDKEFVVDDTMNTWKDMYEEDFEFDDRVVEYPKVYPDGMKLVKESTEISDDGKELLSIMKFANDEASFTLIEQYVNMTDNISYQQEVGEVINILGNPSIMKTSSIITVYNGIEYTIASNSLSYDEMIDVLASFMYEREK